MKIQPALPNEQEVRACINDIYAHGITLGKSKAEFHNYLQNAIAELSSKFSLSPITEYPLLKFRGDRNGRVDVVWSVGSIPVVAFEIDSICRTKSIKKLLVVKSNLLFWIYYGKFPFESFVKSIDQTGRINVIHFSTRFGKFGIKPEIDQAPEISENESVSKKSYSVSDVRLKHSNAYEKWSSENDIILKENYLKGLPINELAKLLQRKPSAIRSRIRKLGLRANAKSN